MEIASGQTILFTDSDLSTSIEQMEPFLEKIKHGAAIVVGTRKHSKANIIQHQPLWRESMGKGFTWLSNTLLGLHISDFTCGFKAFRADAGKHIFGIQLIDGWAYDSEILFLANRAGYEIIEIPVRWINSPDSKVRAVRDTITSLLSLLKIRWNWASGQYNRIKVRESGRIPADV